MIAEEFERTRRMLLVVKQQERLLEKNAVLSRSIRLRNPYVDPMSLIQVDLLRRKQAGDHSEELNYALERPLTALPPGCTIRGKGRSHLRLWLTESRSMFTFLGIQFWQKKKRLAGVRRFHELWETRIS